MRDSDLLSEALWLDRRGVIVTPQRLAAALEELDGGCTAQLSCPLHAPPQLVAAAIVELVHDASPRIPNRRQPPLEEPRPGAGLAE